MIYKTYYILEYLPKRYVANEIQKKNRNRIWRFKDGFIDVMLFLNFASYVNRIIEGKKNEFLICFIPISSNIRTRYRYASFAKKLEDVTSVKTSLRAITKNEDSDFGYIAGKRLHPAEKFQINSNEVGNKRIILIDDIITMGNTFKETADLIMNNGAKSVVGLFAGKTINLDKT